MLHAPGIVETETSFKLRRMVALWRFGFRRSFDNTVQKTVQNRMNCLFQKTNLKFWRLLKSILTSVWQHFFVLVYGLHVYPVCPIVDLYRVPFIVVLVSVGWNIFCYWFKWPVITTVCSTAKTNEIDKLSSVKFASSQLDVINYTVPFMFMTVMFLCSLRKYNLAFSQHMHCLF